MGNLEDACQCTEGEKEGTRFVRMHFDQFGDILECMRYFIFTFNVAECWYLEQIYRALAQAFEEVCR